MNKKDVILGKAKTNGLPRNKLQKLEIGRCLIAQLATELYIRVNRW